ncbi:MAG TPA: SOS response-associated peptidase [Candidatus Didemnitutus sp.]|nr:SOS response-associated peptidase [Candidatus Didemnitutus sp.]
MCNRYTAGGKAEIRAYYLKRFGVVWDEDWNPYLNIPPMSRVPVITWEGGPKALLMRWGTQSAMGLLMNARSETLTTRRTWKDAVDTHRCIMAADGFFEWETVGKAKLGHYFSVKDMPVISIAAVWFPGDAAEPDRCVLVTSQPNEIVKPFHDRMPVILPAGTENDWLGDQPLGQDRINEVCRPFDPARMNQWRVTPKMNSNRYQGADANAPWVEEKGLFDS